jgi:hypothetical protein
VSGYGDFTIAYSRPDELSFFQPFGQQAQAVSIGPEYLYGVTSAATEDKQVAGERVFIKGMLYQLAQTIERFTHIRDASNQPDTGT